MAESTPSIFNEKAEQKLHTPDDLDKYVKITSPSTWVILGACVALLLGLAAWAFFGAVTTSLTTTAVTVKDTTMCFLEASDVAQVKVGDEAVIDGERFTVASVSAVPLSRDEATSELNSDYLMSVLVEGDWIYQVKFDGPSEKTLQGIPLNVSITVARVAPISLVLGGLG